MSLYIAPFTFDFVASKIDVDGGTVDLAVADIYSACKQAQDSIEGVLYARIATGSGLNILGPGVQVGLTVELLGAWQLRFPAGNYVVRIAAGNLIGGPGGDPVAYTAGVQTTLIQSAASTVVTSGGAAAPTVAQITAAVLAGLLGTTIPVDLTKIRGQTLTGAGTAGNPWGP